VLCPSQQPSSRYLNNTTLGAHVARLNPAWNMAYNDETLMEGFLKAMELTGVTGREGGGRSEAG
jgi:hypothetical protein